MLNLLDRYYPRAIFFGLIAAIWFGALCEAAHNVWSASVFFGLITILTALFCAGRAHDGQPVKLPLLLPAILLLLACAISTYRSFDFESSVLELWGVFFTLVSFYLFINTVRSEEDRQRFFSYAGLVVIVLMAHSIWQQLYPPPVSPGILPTVGRFGYGSLKLPLSDLFLSEPLILRYGHWEVHANLINSVVLSGFVLYWALFYSQRLIKNKAYVAPFAACIVALALGRSWWAWASLLAGWGYFEWPRFVDRFRTNRRFIACVFAVCTLLIAGLIYVKTQHHVERAVDQNYYHAKSRLYYWAAALDMIKRYPMTGVGLGGFATAYPHFKTGHTENTLFAHGVVPQILSETGVAGAAALILMAIAYVRLRRRHSLGLNRSSAIFDATLVTIATYSLISINLDFLLNKYTLALFLGASLINIRVPSFPVRPLWIMTVGICFLLISAFWLNLFLASRLYKAGEYWENQGDFVKAANRYTDAIQTEPFHANSYWRLAKLYQRSDQAHPSAEMKDAAGRCLIQAVRYKKDMQFIQELARQRGKVRDEK